MFLNSILGISTSDSFINGSACGFIDYRVYRQDYDDNHEVDAIRVLVPALLVIVEEQCRKDPVRRSHQKDEERKLSHAACKRKKITGYEAALLDRDDEPRHPLRPFDSDDLSRLLYLVG